MEETNGLPGVQGGGVKAGSGQELMRSDRDVSPDELLMPKNFEKGYNTVLWHAQIAFFL